MSATRSISYDGGIDIKAGDYLAPLLIPILIRLLYKNYLTDSPSIFIHNF